MILAWAFLAAASTDAAAAGSDYRTGVRLLEEKKYDEAAAAFEEALRHASAEMPSLRYRDPEGRQDHPYFPYYGLARATLGQAEGDGSAYGRRDRLRLAIRYLDQTAHPLAPARLAEARSALEEAERTIAEREASTPPPELAVLRTKVERLCETESFEDALREIGNAGDLLGKFERLKGDLTTLVRGRQRASLQRYGDILRSRLESICRTDPTLEAEVILPMLRPARVPAELSANPGPHFQWLSDFFPVYEKEIDQIRASRSLPIDRLLASAAAFEASALKALEVRLVPGFRAARNVAHSMRMARLKELAATGDPGSAEFRGSVETLLAACAGTLAGTEEAVRKRTAEWADLTVLEDLKRYLETDLPYQKTQVETARTKVAEMILAYERLVAAEELVRKAGEDLARRGIMAEPDECRKIDQRLTELERQPYFETLTARVRARVLLTRAMCNAVVAFLEADPRGRAVERCRTDVLKAYALAPDVDAPWRGGDVLSPKVLAVFDEIRKR